MACNNKITLAIVNSCTPKKGIEPTAYWGFREELQLTIVDNAITNMVAPPLGVISGSKFFMNAGHDVAVFEDQDDRFLHKFTATITENSVAVDKMDDIVLFVKANGETTWSVYGAKCGLWKTSQAQMANDNHGMTALEFASREGMEEDYSKYVTSIDIAALPNMTTFDLIYGGTMPNNGAVKLTIDAGKIGYILLPNGQILTSNGAGVINATYTGATGSITYYVPKNTLLIDYSGTELIDTDNLALKSAISITSSREVVGGELKTNSSTIFGNLDADTKAKIILSTANGWTLDVLNYIPNLANVMHIGNSITLSVPFGGIWWGTWGMAASEASKDYVNVFNSKLNTDYDITLASKRLNIANWEANHATFDKSTLDSNFDGTEDFIVVKVGENVAETPESLATFTADYVDLIQYIQGKSPNATIILCTSYFTWGNDIKTSMINAAIALNLPYIDLDSLDIPANNSFIGAEVYGDDNILHTINDGAVAAHPSDVGMAAIANLIHQTAWTL